MAKEIKDRRHLAYEIHFPNNVDIKTVKCTFGTLLQDTVALSFAPEDAPKVNIIKKIVVDSQ